MGEGPWAKKMRVGRIAAVPSPGSSSGAMGGSAGAYFATALHENRTLESIDISGNPALGEKGIASIAKAARDHPALSAIKVDGKEFFRQARARLSYEKFSQFLSNIKELNAHKQTRQETLARASEIFGDANADLYATFETLLVKHLPK